MTARDSAHAISRTADPETSKAAALRVAPRRARVRDRVLELFRIIGPMADHELVTRYDDARPLKGWPFAAASSIRSRRNELAQDGVLEPVPDVTRATPGGYRARVWRIASREDDGGA